MSLSAHNSTLAQEGRQKIQWASASMPMLNDASLRLKNSAAVNGLKVGVCLPLDAKVANLALALTASGAHVSCCSLVQDADISIVQALHSNDIPVFLGADAALDEFIALKHNFILDHDARCLTLAHLERSEFMEQLAGATEITKTGIDRLSGLNNISIPIVDLHSTRINQLINNTTGTGQSAVMAMLDITNLQIAGRRALVIGYGRVGKGIAAHAAAMGARVTVAESEPVKALDAHYDGHSVSTIENAITDAELVFTASGVHGVLKAEHIDAMRPGAILCASGHGQAELPMEHLLQAVHIESVRAHVTNYQLANGKNILLIADGHNVNITAGEGSPIEVADKLMALQIIALEHLLSNAQVAGLCNFPENAENQLALSYLNHIGANVAANL